MTPDSGQNGRLIGGCRDGPRDRDDGRPANTRRSQCEDAESATALRQHTTPPTDQRAASPYLPRRLSTGYRGLYGRGAPVSMNEMLRVGGRTVDAVIAQEWVREYLNGRPGQFGYPSYDGYRTNEDSDRLCDGDLLAPCPAQDAGQDQVLR